jgi:ABC-type Na+ efflux pump permease subunit
MIKRARMLGLLLFGLASVLIPARTVLAQESRSGDAAVIAALGAFALVFVVIGLAAYVYMALALSTIAKKTNTENPWLAWIPVINIILMLNIAKKPLWWIILFLVPFVNIVILVLVWMAIAEARKKPNWWGILIIVPFVGLIVPGYLAWAD